MKILNNIVVKHILLCITFLINSTFAKCIPLVSLKSFTDTPKINDIKLQSFIDSRINEINLYNSMTYRKEKIIDTIESYKNKALELSKDTIKDTKFSLKEICLRMNLQNENIIYDSLKDVFKKICFAENEIITINKAIADSLKEIKKLENELDYKQTKYQKSIQEIINKTDTITGFSEYLYNGKMYWLFYVNNIKNEVQINGSPTKGSTSIKNTLDNSKETPLMITNAGMYQPNFKPQGLLISNFQKEMEVDSSKEKRDGNFYLYPNGIFFIDSSKKYHIVTTPDYLKNNYSNKYVKYATQSGPLLINNGSLNSNIREVSSNYNIRSGVGIINENRAVFVISVDGVTFYDFKMVFTTLGCKSALYFDGFVSRMYINDKYPQRASVLSGANHDHDFGPMILVFPKK
jgi:uncharacterized protein YigE (DUF2233 family)